MRFARLSSGHDGAGDRLRAGGGREQRRVRPARRDRRRVRGAGRLAARRRRLRTLGRRVPAPPPPPGRARSGGLVGHGRPQVAERPVRLRDRLLQASGRARLRDGSRSRLPPARGRSQRARTGCPRARAAPAGSRSTPRFASLAGAGWRSWSSGAATTHDASPTCSARAGRRDPQRRRAQPGARPLRWRRRAHARRDRARPAGRHLLARRHGVAGARRDADLCLQLPDDNRGRRPQRRGDPGCLAGILAGRTTTQTQRRVSTSGHDA